jgi:hypothetical protein
VTEPKPTAAELRATCGCWAHRNIRCAERWPGHIAPIVHRVMDEITKREAA